MRHKQQRLLEQNIQHLETYIKEHDLNKNSFGKNTIDSCLITPESMILAITEADPDWQNFKNSKWLIKNLLAKNFLWEDIESGKSSKAYDTLNRFLNIRKQWSDSAIKDIQAYKGLSGIAEAIRPFEITKSMGELKREEKAKIYSETIVVYDKNDYLVVIPKTEEASCFWGRNTEWCTASTKSTNYFDTYNPNGPLIIAITPDNRKYQFHENSTPMNENDEVISNITDPVLSQLALLTGQAEYINPDVLNTLFTDKELVEHSIHASGNVLEYMPEHFMTEELCKLALQYEKNIFTNDRILFEFIPDRFKSDELSRLSVYKNVYTLQYIPMEKRTKELCEYAVSKDPCLIQFVPYEQMSDDLCKLALHKNTYILNYISKEFITEEVLKHILQLENSSHYLGNAKVLSQLTPELILYGIEHNPELLIYLSHSLRTEEVCKLAVQKNGELLKYVPDQHRTAEICTLAVQNNGLAISSVLFDVITEDMCKMAIKQNGNAIVKIPKKFVNQETWEMAVKEDAIVFSGIPQDFITKDMCTEVVLKEPSLFEYVPKKFITQEYCEFLVQKDSRIFDFIPDAYYTQEMCEIAIKENGITINKLPANKRTPELWELAIKANGMALLHMDEAEIQLLNETICKQGILSNPNVFRYIPEHLKTEELCKIALENNGDLIGFVPEKYLSLELCKIAIKNNPYSFMSMPDKFRIEEIALFALEQDHKLYVFGYMLNENITEKLCKTALQYNQETSSYLPADFRYLEKDYKKTIIPEWLNDKTYEIYTRILINNTNILKNEQKMDLSHP